jgi:hypothetical protein
MNTKNLSAAARMSAAALFLSIAPAAFAQESDREGLAPPTPPPFVTDCPEYKEAARRAEALRAQADSHDELAATPGSCVRTYRGILEADERDLKTKRANLQACQERLAELTSGKSTRPNVPQAIADETGYLKGYLAEEQRSRDNLARDHAQLDPLITKFEQQAADERAQARELRRQARKLLDDAVGRCTAPAGDGERKAKKEKKEKDHSMRRRLLGAGLEMGTHIVLRGGHRERERSDDHR